MRDETKRLYDGDIIRAMGRDAYLDRMESAQRPDERKPCRCGRVLIYLDTAADLAGPYVHDFDKCGRICRDITVSD